MRMLDGIIVAIAIILMMALALVAYEMLWAPEYSMAGSDEILNVLADPIQIDLKSEYIPEIRKSGYLVLINPKATYSIDGVLVSKRRYRGGIMNWLSPWDYAIAWGDVTKQLDYIKFSQIIRFAHFRYDPSAPVNVSYVLSHSSNNHLIPANANIRKALGRAKKRSNIRIEGYLVNLTVIKDAKIFSTWNSSTTRIDEGNGACELIYVTRLRLGDRVYE